MKHTLFASFLLLSLQVFAQFGVSSAYLNTQAEQWRSSGADPALSLPGTGWQLGVDYWFRLRNTRIEFLPTLAYSRRHADFNLEQTTGSSTVQSVGFFLHTNFYLLDFKGDCDCPTFSKQGPALQKGLYVQLSPGVSYFDFTLTKPTTELQDNDLNLNFGLALGLDIGLSEGLTLSPFAGLRYYPALEWASLGPETTTAFQFPAKLQPQAD
ncbi:MAG: autotransporter outer membrane beta-barrel domain-containing protein, partial [Bacteroidetes bacterium]